MRVRHTVGVQATAPHWGSKAEYLQVNLRGGFTGKPRLLSSLENLVKLSLLPTCSIVILLVPRKVFQIRRRCVTGLWPWGHPEGLWMFAEGLPGE